MHLQLQFQIDSGEIHGAGLDTGIGERCMWGGIPDTDMVAVVNLSSPQIRAYWDAAKVAGQTLHRYLSDRYLVQSIPADTIPGYTPPEGCGLCVLMGKE